MCQMVYSESFRSKDDGTGRKCASGGRTAAAEGLLVEAFLHSWVPQNALNLARMLVHALLISGVLVKRAMGRLALFVGGRRHHTAPCIW